MGEGMMGLVMFLGFVALVSTLYTVTAGAKYDPAEATERRRRGRSGNRDGGMAMAGDSGACADGGGCG